MSLLRRLLLALLALAAGAAAAGAAPPLVADLSSREIAITTGFAGTELLLFGATEGPGDVVVVVRGPQREQIVRRKIQVAGIWLNGESVRFENVPVFYWVGSTRPLDEIAAPRVLDERAIGTAHLVFAPAEATASAAEFRAALVRAKKRQSLYKEDGKVAVVADRLFRTNVIFPANLPTGDYHAEVYLVRDGRVASQHITTIEVARVVLGARIYNFARQQAALYGIMAIVIALAAGWLAGVIFRKA